MLSTCTTLVEFEAVFAASGTVLDGVHPSMVTHGILQDAGVRRCTDRKAILRRTARFKRPEGCFGVPKTVSIMPTDIAASANGSADAGSHVASGGDATSPPSPPPPPAAAGSTSLDMTMDGRLGQLELAAKTAALQVVAGCSTDPTVEMQPSPQLVQLRRENVALLAELAALLTGGKSNSRNMAHEARRQHPPGAGADGAEYTGAAHPSVAVDVLRPKFGARQLSAADNVFAHNAWDNVVQSPEQIAAARQKVLQQAEYPVGEQYGEQVKHKAWSFWDQFYGKHENKFYKDRRWLFTEFPELFFSRDASTSGQTHPDPAGAEAYERWAYSAHSTYRVLEVGCGAGNTVFPVLAANKDPNLFVYACDFAPTAVDIVRSESAYEPARCHAFVCNLAHDSLGLPDESLDIVILIFVLSALHPDELKRAITKIAKVLKPGGRILLRDYGRYDMAQLRFKQNRLISDNFYARGEGTQVYFFEQEEMHSMLEAEGLVKEQNVFDRRLIINRKTEQQMFRVWLQCKYRKPLK